MKFDKESLIVILAVVAFLLLWITFAPRLFQKDEPETANEERKIEESQTPPTPPAPQQEPLQTASPQTSASAPASVLPAVPLPTEVIAIQNAKTTYHLDSATGSVVAAKLKGKAYENSKTGDPIDLIVSESDAPGTFQLDLGVPAVKVAKAEIRDGQVVFFREFANGLQVRQTFRLENDGYLLSCLYEFINPAQTPLLIPDAKIFLSGVPSISALTGRKVNSERMNVEYCPVDGDVSVADPTGNGEKYESKAHSGAPVRWISSSNKYFASILFAPQNAPFASSDASRVFIDRVVSGKAERLPLPHAIARLGTLSLPPGTSVLSIETFAGPKEMKLIRDLAETYPDLTSIMHISYWSWFEFIARPMLWFLTWLKGIVGSYGWAIIALTILVRAIFWPITQKANASMRRMSKIQPVMKELREKYKDSPQELNVKMMELYRKEKVNPLGGCLPILLQIPVFIALYSALDCAVELRGVSFLWCKDLSMPDLVGPRLPFSIPLLGQIGLHPLILIMTALMIVQQKMMPATGDPTQRKMMMAVPIVMLVMLYDLPSGLTLYWTVSQIFSILQMKYGQYMAKREEAANAASAAHGQ